MAALGIQISGLPGAPGYFEIWPENWDIATTFLRLERRWILAPMGGYRCLDDAAMLSQFEIFQVSRKNRSAIYEGLMVMESAALEVLNV